MPLPSPVSYEESDAAKLAISFSDFLPINWSLFLEPTFIDSSKWYWNCLYWDFFTVILVLSSEDHHDSCSSNTNNGSSISSQAYQLYHIFTSAHSASAPYWSLSVVLSSFTWMFCFSMKLCILLHLLDLHLWYSCLTHRFLPGCCFSSVCLPGSCPCCCLINCSSAFADLPVALFLISAGQFWVWFVSVALLGSWKISCSFCFTEISHLEEDSAPLDFDSDHLLHIWMDIPN